MTTSRPDVRAPARPHTPERRRRAVVPPQHGAWAFLLLPVALGVVAGGWSWYAVPALLGWVALYPFSWALTNRLAARRPERFNGALQVWSVVAVPLLVAAVVLHPWLLWIGSAYALPFAVNVVFASARRERSLANDAVLILECAAATPVVAALASEHGSWVVPWSALATGQVALATLVCGLVLAGSTLHVRSLVRERSNPAFTRASRVLAVASLPVVALASAGAADAAWPLVAAFAVLAARAFLLHDPTWRPARIGLVELGGMGLVVACSVVTLA